MKAAPGGQLPVQDIFGRDAFIAELWRLLETNSVRMEAERRIGKTSILHKMAAEPASGWTVLSFDLESIHSADEFAETLCKKVQASLTGLKKQGRRIGDFLASLGSAEVAGFKFPEKAKRPEGYWKTLLTGAIEDLVEQQEELGKRVVFFFDEMPWMLSAIAGSKTDGAQTAMEVLDVLRSLRQSTTTGQGFRMILCGSVGLHHVLDTLKREGYRNQPVNDMRLVEVDPFDAATATEFAKRLLEGEGLPTRPGPIKKIVEQTGGYPFYIQWVISELKKRGQSVSVEAIESVIKTLLTDSLDPCDLRHFKTRIESYYPNEGEVALAILDCAAVSTTPLAQKDLINAARLAGEIQDNRIRELLRLLAVDHYLARDLEGQYSFRHTLLRRWWVIEQGLV